MSNQQSHQVLIRQAQSLGRIIQNMVRSEEWRGALVTLDEVAEKLVAIDEKTGFKEIGLTCLLGNKAIGTVFEMLGRNVGLVKEAMKAAVDPLQ
jgi:hypothetical protein